MLGDVDHVGRGWPATPGSWLASGHPNATPTPTHAVLNPPRATQPPCTSTEASPQPAAKLGERETAGPRGWGGSGGKRGDVWVAQRDSTYYPLTLLPNSGGIENWKPPLVAKFRRCIRYETNAAPRLAPSPVRAVPCNPIKYGTEPAEEIAGVWSADAPEGRHYGFTGRHTRPGRNRPERDLARDLRRALSSSRLTWFRQ